MSSSRETNDDTQFHPADYCVFAASLALSAGIGVYYGLCGDKKKKDDDDDDAKAEEKKDADDDGGMSPLPVSFSVLASFLAAPFVLGTPAEMYVYGTMYSLVVIGFGLAVPFVSHMIIPVFHKLKITSGYQVSGGDNDVTVISLRISSCHGNMSRQPAAVGTQWRADRNLMITTNTCRCHISLFCS